MGRLVIDFTPEGVVQALHMPVFDLGFLGAQEITRATDIRHDFHTQSWGIYYPITGGEFTLVQAGLASYDIARKVEVQWLNTVRMDGIDPLSDAGIQLLRAYAALATDPATPS